ncbi:MAG: alpha/beta hydrolase [Patescibacteria group bacterium]
MFRTIFRTLTALVVMCLAVICIAYAYIVGVVESKDSIEAAPITTKFINVNGESLAYQKIDTGGDVTIVFVGGLSGWSETWDRTVQSLDAKTSGYNYVTLDLPPFGYSVPDVSRGYYRDVQADRIGEVIQNLDLNRVILVAHSYGAGPAAEYVLRGTGVVEKFIIIDGVLNIDEAKKEPSKYGVIQVGPIRDAAIAILAHYTPFVKSRLKSFVYVTDHIDDQLVRRYMHPFDIAGNASKLSQWLKDYVNDPLVYKSTASEEYKNLSIPVRLIWGDKDTLTPISLTQVLLDSIPDIKLHTLQNVGHIPMIEDYDAIDAALLEALSG